jgi:outer membrane protein TolC
VSFTSAAEENAIERFFPWLAPGVTYRRHDNLIQNTEGVIEEVHKQSYAPGGAVAAQTDIGDAIFKSLEAHQLTKAARHGLDAQRAETVLGAAQGYFDLAAAQEAVGIAREALGISTDYATQIERAVDAGIAFKGDALRVKVQQQKDEIALRRTEENARIASAKLVQLLHIEPTIELVPRDVSLVPLSIVSTEEPLGALVAQALAARPETRQSAALVSAAQHANNRRRNLRLRIAVLRPIESRCCDSSLIVRKRAVGFRVQYRLFARQNQQLKPSPNSIPLS